MELSTLSTPQGITAAIKAHHKNLHKNHSFPPLTGAKPIHCFAELFINPKTGKPFESAEPFEAALKKITLEHAPLPAKSTHIPEHERHFITTHPKNNQDVVVEFDQHNAFVRAFYEWDAEDVDMNERLLQSFKSDLVEYLALSSPNTVPTNLPAPVSNSNLSCPTHLSCPAYLNLSKEGFSQVIKVYLFDDNDAMGMDHATLRVQCLDEKDFIITTISRELLDQPLQTFYLDSNHALVTIGYVQVVIGLNERHVNVNVIEQNEKLPLNASKSALHQPRCESIDNELVLKSLDKDAYAKTVYQYLGLIDHTINMSQSEINQSMHDELSVTQAANRKLAGLWKINILESGKITILLGDDNPLKYLKHSSANIVDIELFPTVQRDDDVLVCLSRGAGKRWVTWQEDLAHSICDLTDR
jgi:hypothetical protein